MTCTAHIPNPWVFQSCCSLGINSLVTEWLKHKSPGKRVISDSPKWVLLLCGLQTVGEAKFLQSPLTLSLRESTTWGEASICVERISLAVTLPLPAESGTEEQEMGSLIPHMNLILRRPRHLTSQIAPTGVVGFQSCPDKTLIRGKTPYRSHLQPQPSRPWWPHKACR